MFIIITMIGNFAGSQVISGQGIPFRGFVRGFVVFMGSGFGRRGEKMAGNELGHSGFGCIQDMSGKGMIRGISPTLLFVCTTVHLCTTEICSSFINAIFHVLQMNLE